MKKINSKADLAINGSAPAFIEKLHVGRPNMGDKAAFQKYVDQIFENHWLSNNGPLVQELEHRIAEHHQAKNCIAMCNGTIALEIAIRALDLTGEVILPSYTFIATAHALHWQEITPVFADIDPVTHCLDPASVRKMITPKTAGIIGVHLWGHAAPVNELQQIADEHGLKLMFDAAHAFGCSYKGKMIGNFGQAEVLSFHATKFFNTFEGGAVLTNDDELAEKMRLMRNFGFAGMDNVIHPGTNGKMTEIHAAMGLVNLDNVDKVIRRNEENYRAYQKGITGLPGLSIYTFDENEKNNFQYVVLEVGDDCPVSRDEIIEALHAENILARKYFWPGCHKMLPYRELYPHAGLLLPITQRVAEKVVVIPTGTSVTPDEVSFICQVLIKLVEFS
ncbi:dTDP-4-dehydro-6-deoxyglucose aminotransferase [Methylophaga nitratireducenticrescens]|uniref:Aminotransferase n=1 Tax=Methylophaga nitratireducenticrescens TaxID=754476 RepID=I1XHQ8_METNJ|nr:DegT/DnrJ/EryC1/StrS family aminotransferase [Methylophaga nitratireducenticrescens]AFI83927.1 dTDP-4-dehydro-6-deoxyglucose aminotransferase [Methylophaga nitratireducenticrescens]